MAVSLTGALARPSVVSDGHGWRVDANAVAQACERLGVTAPVRIIASPFRRGRWSGMHTLLANGVHEIRVGERLSAERASRTLWHELSHAGQADRGIRGGTTRVRREQGRDAYLADPREVEARAAEPNHEWLPLTH